MSHVFFQVSFIRMSSNVYVACVPSGVIHPDADITYVETGKDAITPLAVVVNATKLVPHSHLLSYFFFQSVFGK